MARIKFRCPECNKKLSATERDFGRQGECPRCQAHFDVGPEMLEDPGPDAEVHWDAVEESAEADEGERSAATFQLEGFEDEEEREAGEQRPAPPVLSEPFLDEFEGAGPGTGPSALPPVAPSVPWVAGAPRHAPGDPLLRFLSAGFRIIGALAVLAGTIGCLTAAAMAVAGPGEQAPVFGVLIAAGAVFMSGAALFAIGEFLAVLPEVRDEARRQTDLLRAVLRKLPSGSRRRQ
jgi:hypothetical protein